MQPRWLPLLCDPACESDPTLDTTDQILGVSDTLIAGEKRIHHYHDWYAILQLPHVTADLGLIATHYRQLAILLNPHRNRLPFADEAFKLVYDAWSVLNPFVTLRLTSVTYRNGRYGL